MISLYKIYKLLSIKRQLQVYIVFSFIILSNLAELSSIGAIIPLLAVLTDINILNNFLENNLYLSLDLEKFDTKNLKFNIISFFICIVFISGLLRLFTQWLIAKYTFSVQTDISTKTFDSIINQNYTEHINRNTSEIISGISIKVSLFRGSFFQFLNTISALFFIIVLIGSILFISLKAGALIISISTFLYFLIWFFCKKLTSFNGKLISSMANKVTKITQEAMGSIRDILVNSNQIFFTNIFFDASAKLYNAHAKVWFITSAPKIIIETLALILIAVSALYFITQSDDIISYIPFLGSLAVAAQRFLPALNNVYMGATTILGNNASVEDLINLVQLPNVKKLSISKNKNDIKFNSNFELKDVNFKYKKNLDNVIKKINLKINKGDWVGIIGKTGSGKSTLVDIIMGLLSPTSGQIFVDGKSLSKNNIINWQKHISHVPQNIFLSDLSIKENIAFGINKNCININKVEDLIEKCNLSEVILQLPEKLDTKVGEKGINFSGGQIQRIAIARALYKDPNLIVLDEATSGLDKITEKKIIDTINNIPKHITILMITHNKDILMKCNKIINIENGELETQTIL
jgi:ATP-binding cassette, subfamily B, bacterial PglK